MEDIMNFLNSPFGLLLTGALVSGLFVQFIVINWQNKRQEQNWVQQQRFTNSKIKMDKRLDEQYKLLEEINNAAFEMMARSEGYLEIYSKIKKRLSELSSATDAYNMLNEQLSNETLDYNKVNDIWQIKVRTIPIKLRLYFNIDLSEQWSSIKEQFDDLDRAISRRENRDICNEKIKGMYQAMEKLFQKMYTEMNNLEMEEVH
jgi:hypothetical protein